MEKNLFSFVAATTKPFKLYMVMQRIAFIVLMMELFIACSKGEQMRLQLERLEQANRNDSVMQNDSLAERLVGYFDLHGSANERMRAYYILGRTYFDLGELPRALETYYKAVDCPDSTASDCDFKTLSRVHAQAAEVFHRQVQPKSRLNELKKAIYYANLANDTLMAIECFSERGDAYRALGIHDSVISIKEAVAQQFLKVNRKDRYAQSLGASLTSVVKKGDLQKARQYIDIYERFSGFFDDNGNIRKGREMYYYTKAEYYLAVSQLDSAEYLLRLLLRSCSTMNHKIAANKGLQQVYTLRGISDSIAKFANLSYELNDSAYSLSEMENIQKLQASYNYNHNKLLAEQKAYEVERMKNLLLIILIAILVLGLFVARKYSDMRKAAFDYRLRNSVIARRLHRIAKNNPPKAANYDDLVKARQFVEHEIPSFRKTFFSKDYKPTDMEYDVCILVRLGITPIEISHLKGCSPSYVSNMRKRLLFKIFGKEGGSEEFDDEIAKISINVMQ